MFSRWISSTYSSLSTHPFSLSSSMPIAWNFTNFTSMLADTLQMPSPWISRMSVRSTSSIPRRRRFQTIAACVSGDSPLKLKMVNSLCGGGGGGGAMRTCPAIRTRFEKMSASISSTLRFGAGGLEAVRFLEKIGFGAQGLQMSSIGIGVSIGKMFWKRFVRFDVQSKNFHRVWLRYHSLTGHAGNCTARRLLTIFFFKFLLHGHHVLGGRLWNRLPFRCFHFYCFIASWHSYWLVSKRNSRTFRLSKLTFQYFLHLSAAQSPPWRPSRTAGAHLSILRACWSWFCPVASWENWELSGTFRLLPSDRCVRFGMSRQISWPRKRETFILAVGTVQAFDLFQSHILSNYQFKWSLFINDNSDEKHQQSVPNDSPFPIVFDSFYPVLSRCCHQP